MTAKKVVTEEQARAAWRKIEAGESSVIKEAKALGFSTRLALREALIALVGEERYKQTASALTAAGWRKPREEVKE
jgi:methylphosphotriester-DNA--protein-cysteine methyltransferase